MFGEIERRGFDFRNFNEYGVGTLHYDVKSIAQNTNLGDWVPQWCFWFMEKALASQGGRASLKLDWFAARGLAVDPAFPPKVIGKLADEGGPLSDHDAITVGVRPLEQKTAVSK